MFSKDISHQRPTPRTLQSSKFGPYAKLTTVAKSQGLADALFTVASVVCVVVMVGLLVWRG